MKLQHRSEVPVWWYERLTCRGHHSARRLHVGSGAGRRVSHHWRRRPTEARRGDGQIGGLKVRRRQRSIKGARGRLLNAARRRLSAWRWSADGWRRIHSRRTIEAASGRQHCRLQPYEIVSEFYFDSNSIKQNGQKLPLKQICLSLIIELQIVSFNHEGLSIILRDE